MSAKLLSASLVTGLAAGGLAYAAQWPTSQLFGRTLIAGHDVNELALTFDDGPNDPYTEQLLEILARYQAKAIFFFIGNFVRRRPDLARAVRAAGHLIGNHTMSHPSLMKVRPLRVRRELMDCNALLEDTIGEAVRYFRPPFGTRRPDVLRTVRDLGLTPVMWNITAHDWDAKDAQALAARVERLWRRNQARGRGSNLLLHDGGHLQMGTDRSVTLAATRSLLQTWAGTQLRLVSIDTWQARSEPHA